jgi:4a-hydroxytetrahydrobiopterin dehydratase
MNDLAQQQSKALSKDDSALTHEEARVLLSELEPLWTLNADSSTISHSFVFDNYYQTIAFVNVIAQIAHQQDHHPDLEVSYNRCQVTYSTHSVGGLSINDFICAAKINAAQSL